MQFSVDKAELCRALALVAGALEKKETIPILSHVRLEAREGSLGIVGTDLEKALSVSIPATVKEPGVTTAPGARLLNYCKLLDGEVQVKVDEKFYLSITSGRSRTRIAGMSPDSFPQPPVAPEVARVTMDARLFARLLGRVAFAISRDASRFTLNGAKVEFLDGVARVIATDGHRLAMADTPCKAEPYGFIMPMAAMQCFTKLADASEGGARVDIGADDNHLFFEVGPWLLTVRQITGSFPDYKRVMPGHETCVSVNRSEFKAALERVRQFADERSRCVRLVFRDGEIGIYAQSVEVGEAEDSVACEGSITAEVGFNSTYILDALGSIDHERAAFFVKDAKVSAEVRPMSGAGTDQDPYKPGTDQRIVIMPMRI